MTTVLNPQSALPSNLAGVSRALNPRPEDPWQRPLAEEIEDELDSEREAAKAQDMLDHKPVDSTLQEAIMNASKGVSEKTDAQYKRLMKQCEDFSVSQQYIKAGEPFFSATPNPNTPLYIVAWIMESCDTINLDGSLKDPSKQRDSYSHAQKMRAAATYGFNKIHGLSMPWHESELTPGMMIGNPSFSSIVSAYMVSLRRRKAQAGETATSARAMTMDIMETIYDLNHQPENWEVRSYAPGTRSDPEDINQWAGGRLRRMLFCAFTIALICLLRIDEVLRIRFQDIEWVTKDCIKITLPFRKTDQFGEIQPFYIHKFPDPLQFLCPLRALAEWIKVSKLSEGYVLRRMYSGDRPSSDDVPMSSEQFLEFFRNTLLDINIDPYPYGTHSFRRGGCQFLAEHLRWSLRRICEWGGWSTEFTHLTIVKYLISWNDEPSMPRKDFFDLNRPPVMKCFLCGRSCACGA